MADAGAIKAGKAFVEIFANDLGMKAGLDRASARLRGWAATTSKIGLGLIGAGTAIVAPLAIAGVQAASYGDSLNDVATRTGLAIDKIVGLGYAAELSGSSMEAVEGGIKKMQVALVSAVGGSEQAVAAFSALGLSVDDLMKLSPDEQFKAIADQLDRVQDPALRAAAAVAIFGKSGTDLLPVMQGGAAGIDAMQKKAEDLGLTMAGRVAAGVGDVDDLIGGLTMQFVALKTVVGASIAGALRPLITAVQPVVTKWIEWSAANQGLFKTILYVGAGLVAVGGALVGAGVGASVLLSAYGSLIAVGSAVGGVLVSAVTAMLSPIGLVTTAILGGVGALTYLSGYGGDVLKYLGESWGNLKATALDSWRGIVAAVGAGDLALAGQIAWGGMKLGFAEVVGYMKEAWNGFKTLFLTVATNAWTGALSSWESTTFGIAGAWISAVKVMGDVWQGFKGVLRSGWESTMNFMEDKWLDLIAKTEGLDRGELQKSADQQRAARSKDAGSSDAAEAAARQKEYDAQQRQLAADHQKQLADIAAKGEADAQALQGANQDQQTAIAADLAKKRAELDALIAKAKALATRQPGTSTGPQRPDVPTMDDLNANKNSFESRGTFSGFNLASLNAGGGGNDVESNTAKTATAAEKMVGLLEALNAKDGGVLFT